MPLPRFRLRTLMIAVPVVGVILALAIQAAAAIGSVREGLVLVLLLSIAWVPAVFVFLPLKVAGGSSCWRSRRRSCRWPTPSTFGGVPASPFLLVPPWAG